MPCDTRIPVGMTIEERLDQIQASIGRLETALGNGDVSVVVGENGAVAFAGWENRDKVSDVCAYRALELEGSFALREAVARAETLSGNQVNAEAVAAGIHSHDGGRTWSAGH